MKKQVHFQGTFLAAVKQRPTVHATRYHTGRSKYEPGTIGAKQAAKLAKRIAP